jgi:hypothetical protein
VPQHSSIPTLKANLRTQLLARGGLAGVQVSYGPPIPNPQREIISLHDVTGETHPQAMAKSIYPRDELYTLDVIVFVLHEGTDQRATTERAFAIANEVYDQLQTDPTVNGAVWFAQIEGPIELRERASEDGMNRSAEYTIPVYCRMRMST